MRVEAFLKELGPLLANALGSQSTFAEHFGCPLSEVDLSGAAPSELAIHGRGHVVVTVGERLMIELAPGAEDDWRFVLHEDRLSIASRNAGQPLQITLPPLKRIALAGSGRMECEETARDAQISIAGSARLEIASIAGGDVAVSLAGSGRLMANGVADTLRLSIAGSGSCDAEGLVAENAAVNIAGSGAAIFTCNGEVSANLMGSGDLIVRGPARCSVRSMGSGKVVCERAPADT